MTRPALTAMKVRFTKFSGLRDTTAADVMVPRADIVSVALADGFDDIIQQMSDANHSRVPVYRDTLDDVAGIIHIKDLFANLRNDQTPGLTVYCDLRCLFRQLSAFWICCTRCDYAVAIWLWLWMSLAVLMA